ncbi:cupin domain-containing protein [Geminicoccaceae bacterium 1502E]|nr:cupin domain-containing protein [Geminicoccaceae bacterium 1502E]
MDPQSVIRSLGMQPHPEGGWYVETYREAGAGGERGAVSAIYFLLEAGQRSHWHRVDATEIWLWHAGGPLRLTVLAEHGQRHHLLLGPDLAEGERPQAVIPARSWQEARPLAGWSLVSCIVAPAFDFAGFELAPPGWQPS